MEHANFIGIKPFTMQQGIYLRALILMFSAAVTIFSCERVEKPNMFRSPKGAVTLGGTLKVPIRKFPEILDPSNMVGGSAVEVGVHLYDGLVRFDPFTSEVIPGLAKSWSMEKSENAILFNLKNGVRFNSNETLGYSKEVVASDVVNSLNRLAKNADSTLFKATIGGRLIGSEAFRNGTAESIEGIQVIDDYTIRLRLVKPDRSFLYILAQPALGIVQQEEAGNIVAAGPYSIVSGETKGVLARNPTYHIRDEFGNQFPYIDTLIFVEVQSNSEKLEAFFDGKIDIITNLEMDPVRSILEEHVADFSGANAKYVMERESDNASYETYRIYRSGLKGLGNGFMGYQDYSRAQIEQN